MTTRREASLFERVLNGEPVEAPSVELLDLAQIVRTIPRPRLEPDPAFVGRLRERLAEQARTPPAATAVARAPVRRPGDPSRRTVVLRLPRGIVSGVVAGAAGLAVLVAGLSTQALPGDRLYPVKLELGQAQVRLAGDDLGRGRALLGQVDQRLDEVAALVAEGDPRSSRINLALTAAAEDLGSAQRLLLNTRDGRPDPQALQALADATALATDRLRALGPKIPTSSDEQLQRLLDLLAGGDTVMMSQLSACGSPCAGLLRTIEATLTPSRGSLPGIESGPAAGAGGAGAGIGERNTPATAASTGAPPAPSAPADGGDSTTGQTLPGLTVPGMSLPGATVPPALPPASARSTGSTSGSVLDVPSLTLPTISVPSPSIAITTSAAVTTSCAVVVGGVCISG